MTSDCVVNMDALQTFDSKQYSLEKNVATKFYQAFTL